MNHRPVTPSGAHAAGAGRTCGLHSSGKHANSQHIGPQELLVAAKIAVRSDDTAQCVARTIDAAEERIRAA